jgi:hypothetical protein
MPKVMLIKPKTKVDDFPSAQILDQLYKNFCYNETLKAFSIFHQLIASLDTVYI